MLKCNWLCLFFADTLYTAFQTRGQSNLTKSAHSPVMGHPRGSKVVPLNSWANNNNNNNRISIPALVVTSEVVAEPVRSRKSAIVG